MQFDVAVSMNSVPIYKWNSSIRTGIFVLLLWFWAFTARSEYSLLLGSQKCQAYGLAVIDCVVIFLELEFQRLC